MFHFAGMDQSKVPDAKKSDEEMPEQDKETASPSVDPCSPTAFSSSWAESSLRQGKLVFVPPKRGLPSLNRGYSTPDPSPRCHLPKCGALELMIGAEDDLSDSSGVPRSYGTPRHRIETEPWNMILCGLRASASNTLCTLERCRHVASVDLPSLPCDLVKLLVRCGVGSACDP